MCSSISIAFWKSNISYGLPNGAAINSQNALRFENYAHKMRSGVRFNMNTPYYQCMVPHSKYMIGSHNRLLFIMGYLYLERRSLPWNAPCCVLQWLDIHPFYPWWRIKGGTKWPPFCRQYFQVHFYEWTDDKPLSEHDCLLKLLFRCRSKKTSNLRVTDLCVGNSPVTGGFPTQMASNAGNVSIRWRHHAWRNCICVHSERKNE